MHALLHSLPPTLQQATTDPHLCWRLLDTQRWVRVSLLGVLLFFAGFWCIQDSVFALQESFPHSYVRSDSSMVGLMGPPPRGLMPYSSLLCQEPLALWQSTADLYLHRRCSNTVLSQSLWGLWVRVHRRFVWALWASLVGEGLDSICRFAPPTVLLAILWPFKGYLLTAAPVKHSLCSWPWTWGISSLHLTAPGPHSHCSLLQQKAKGKKKDIPIWMQSSKE